MSEIDAAYEQTSFSMDSVGANGKYQLPVSQGPTYEMSGRPDPESVKPVLDSAGYALIAPHTEMNYLSTKLLDSETNEFAHIKMTGNKLRIFPKDEDFSKETLERLVNTFRKKICSLELVSENADGADENE